MSALVLYKYESRVLDGVVLDPNEDPEVPVNLDTANGGLTAFELEIKVLPGDADPPLVSRTLGSGIEIDADQTTNPGEFTVAFTITNLTALEAGTYWYDLVATFADGSRVYVIKPSPVHIRDIVNPN